MWTSDESLGEYGSAEEFYPGDVKAYGLGWGYQRFNWKKLFSTVIPNFPNWSYAGFFGSMFWLIGMIAIGVFLLRRKIE